MSDKLYEVTFSNGLTVRDCEMYDNLDEWEFHTPAELKPEDFDHGMRSVIVKDQSTGEARDFKNVIFGGCVDWMRGCMEDMEKIGVMFKIRKQTLDELKYEQLRGNVEYVAMMTGVEL